MENLGEIEGSVNAKEKQRKEHSSKTPDFMELSGEPYSEMEKYEYQGFDIREEEEIEALKTRMIELEEQLENLTPEEEILVKEKRKNLREHFEKHRTFERNEAFLESSLWRVEKRERKNKNSDTFVRNDEIDRLDELLSDQKNLKEELKQKNPEAFYAGHITELKTYKQQLDEGALVEVPYVREKLDTVKESMRRCEPVFLHGHLGAGKSVSAFESAKEFMVDFHVQKDFEQWMNEQIEQLQTSGKREVERYNRETEEMETVEISEKPNKDELGAKIMKLRKFYETDSSVETKEKISFYAIAGSKETSVSDLYTMKSLGLEKINGKSFADHNQEINDIFEEVLKEEGVENVENLDTKERDEYMKRALQIHKTKNEGFGTVVEDIKMELRRAIEEGKPFVFDEVNAVPVEVLLAMNDLLTKKPGDKAFIPGVGDVEIADGFAPVFTGNMNAGLAQYHGVNDLNPAFLSRLKPIEFDYPPQRVEGNFNTTVSEGENQLFHILVANALDKNGNANLPDGSFEKMYNLAILAAKSQKIFSGKWKESGVNEVDGIAPQLEKTVLSVRALSKILEEWDGGRNMDIDMAVWKSFIDTATVPSDKRLLYRVAQESGFFDEKDGWKSISELGDITDSSLIGENDVRDGEYKFIKQERVFTSAKEVVTMLAGEAPERVFEIENGVKESIERKDLQALENFLGGVNVDIYENALVEACPV